MDNLHRHGMFKMVSMSKATHQMSFSSALGRENWYVREWLHRSSTQALFRPDVSHVTQCTPGMKAFRTIVSHAATKVSPRPPKLLFVWDICVASMHAAYPPGEEIYMTLPECYSSPGYCWHLSIYFA
eukprot:4157123-Amphidinium_carterae.2